MCCFVVGFKLRLAVIPNHNFFLIIIVISFFLCVLANLHVKDECSRQQAAALLKNLAHQCSDPETIEELIKHLVAVLNGMILVFHAK